MFDSADKTLWLNCDDQKANSSQLQTEVSNMVFKQKQNKEVRTQLLTTTAAGPLGGFTEDECEMLRFRHSTKLWSV